MARGPKPAGSEQDNDSWMPTDEALGIGVDDAPRADAQGRIEAAMADPVIAAAVEQLVQQRVAEMAGSAGSVAAPDLLVAMQALGKQIADSINRSTAATVEQMPGHVKPIPVEEVEARQSAYIEMTALVRDTTRQWQELTDQGEMIRAEEVAPVYLLHEDFFGNGETGCEMYVAGDTIRWFAAPGTYMEPRNGTAKAISEAMWRYIGGKAGPSAEDLAVQVSQMHRPHAAGANIPEMPPLLSSVASRGGRLGGSKVDGIESVQVGPDRIMGTVVQEMKGGFGRGPRQVRGAYPDAMG